MPRIGHAAVRRPTPFQRMLLASDGTVTFLLEAWAGEPVEAVKLRHDPGTASTADRALLDLARGASVLRREVVLQGAVTGRVLLHAEALLATDRVPPTVIDGLSTTNAPMGRLLAAARTETFREILHVGTEPATLSGRYIGVLADADVVVRSYRISNGGRPIMVVTERFAPDLFEELSAPSPVDQCRLNVVPPVTPP